MNALAKVIAKLPANAEVTLTCPGCGAVSTTSLTTLIARMVQAMTWQAEIPSSAGLLMTYKSGAETTERTVIPQAAQGTIVNGHRRITEFEAFCTLRKARRTFMLAGVINAVEPGTGAEVNPEDWLLARCRTGP